jgi:hypothetical protein
LIASVAGEDLAEIALAAVVDLAAAATDSVAGALAALAVEAAADSGAGAEN